MGAHLDKGSGYSSQPPRLTASSSLPCISTMTDNSQRPDSQGRALPALNMAINILNITKEATNTTPVNPIFGSVALLLTMIRVNSLPFRDEMLEAHTKSGHNGQRRGLRQSWAILRRYLQGSRARNRWKNVE